MIRVILPAFNEAVSIGPTVRAIALEADRSSEPHQVILVDDGSVDETVVNARAAADVGPSVSLLVLQHPENRGLGGAIRTGLYWAADHAGADDVIVIMDADATHPAGLIDEMASLIRGGRDVVIASRYEAGATVVGVPLYRRLLSDGGRLLFKAAFPIRGVRDYTSGFRAYGVPVLRRARVVYGDELCTQRGFEATVDLLLRLRQVGIVAAEVPLALDYSARVGLSKMRVGRTVRSSLWLIARRLVDRWTRYSPGRVRAALAAGGTASEAVPAQAISDQTSVARAPTPSSRAGD